AVLRLAPRLAAWPALDRLDFKVREQIPNSGLESFQALVAEHDGRLLHQIQELAALDEWRSLESPPADWAARLAGLPNLFQPSPPQQDRDRNSVIEIRSHPAVLRVFNEALQEAVQALDPERPLGLKAFWRAVKAALRLKPLRLDNKRRNAVHVISAPEARQWALPVIFVCGMVEKQFPRVHPQDPFFPDPARYELQRAGIRVRTAADFDREEHALFDSALTRASVLVTLSYPEFGSRGERNLPSVFLESLLVPPIDARRARPKPDHESAYSPAPVIKTPDLLAALRKRTARVAVSALESYLQCAFQHFGRLLRLKTVPARPEDRLDFSRQGEIVHAVLAECRPDGGEIREQFERIFAEHCERHHVPQGYHTERLRNAMLADLERFAADDQWPRVRFESQTEKKFALPLGEALEVTGRIDRIDRFGDQAYVIDYKYSGVQRVKERRDAAQLQGPVYLLAAEKELGTKPAGMFFVGLKGGVQYVGWSEEGLLKSPPIPEEWRTTEDRVLQLVEEIRQGRIEPLPADPASCRFCDWRDVCRFEVHGAAAAEGA
ncbi:MAG: PD-(D/E)XK nuclease family protein, partial [Acidobacteriia bacterium]|nr:PD-(D/E)XK nuclease family protein [Terriglobia bacterium]